MLPHLDEAKITSTPLHSAERAAYKTDHAEVGAKLLKHWNFPEGIIAAIAWHHAPDRAGRNHSTIAAIVYAANVLAYRVGTGYGFPPYAGSPDLAALRGIGLRLQELFDYEGDVRDALERERRKFQL